MKIATIIGARPQFIKAAPVSRAIAENNRYKEVIIHTGQHFETYMSDIFFRELNIRWPDYNLNINSSSHGAMTGRMLEKIEEILIKNKPDVVLVYGDTNSTLAGALAGVKLRIPVAHIEAGLRSYNREMPEEINRILTDHCTDILFCPTETAIKNLERESFAEILNDGKLITPSYALPMTSFSSPIALNVGDTMYDAVLQFSEIARSRSTILKKLRIEPKEYFLATIHRPYNTDVPENIQNIISAFIELNEPIIFPIHPRTKKVLQSNYPSLLKHNSSLKIISPVGYLDMLVLEQNAKAILTDSGGMQKEAYFFCVPCITLRPETEWVETVKTGWNILVDIDKTAIIETIAEYHFPDKQSQVFGDGQAAQRIMEILKNYAGK